MSVEPAPTSEDKVRYDQVRQSLIEALTQKRRVDKQLAQLEAQLYNFEASYLTETAAHSGGNIIQGFDGYLKNQPGARRRLEISDSDRIFSNSSTTYQKSLELAGENDEAEDRSSPAANGAAKASSNSLTTVVLPPATRSEGLTAAQQKKMRDKEYQRRKRAANSLRAASMASGEDDGEVTLRRPTKRVRVQEDD